MHFPNRIVAVDVIYLHSSALYGVQTTSGVLHAIHQRQRKGSMKDIGMVSTTRSRLLHSRTCLCIACKESLDGGSRIPTGLNVVWTTSCCVKIPRVTATKRTAGCPYRRTIWPCRPFEILSASQNRISPCHFGRSTVALDIPCMRNKLVNRADKERTVDNGCGCQIHGFLLRDSMCNFTVYLWNYLAVSISQKPILRLHELALVGYFQKQSKARIRIKCRKAHQRCTTKGRLI